ncbi:uncharacterized protein LOC121869421 [Homarus americanus]|uniref:uncharacterized protein LOC121869421 n=1 Tax=Homarus americanus TaxID=6706 RepID=UPI001C477EA5|nr:uncharacterized protein LOC121869421 [Homarus americanus]
MRVSSVALVLCLVSWASVQVEGLFPLGGVTTGVVGLAALKALYWKFKLGGVGLGGHLGPLGLLKGIGKRSVENPGEGDEQLLLTTVGELDQNGCILKTLCQLQTKKEGSRTLEEKLLAELFANRTEVTAYNAPFVHAIDIGRRTGKSAVCDQLFHKCQLSDTELSSLLQQAWGCGFDVFEDKSE